MIHIILVRGMRNIRLGSGRLGSLCIAITAAMSLLFANTPLASANNYGVGDVVYTADSMYGQQATWTVKSSTVPDCTNQGHINETIWLNTNASSGTYWVEDGSTHCLHNNVGYYLYWADNRPNGGGYHDHLGPAVSVGDQFNFLITHSGSEQWSIYAGGFLIGYSTSNPGPCYMQKQGIESSSTGQADITLVSIVQWQDNTPSHNWHYWGVDGSSAAVYLQSGGYYFYYPISGNYAYDDNGHN